MTYLVKEKNRGHNMKNITMDYLRNHTFELTGLEEQTETKEKMSAMFSPQQLSRLPRGDMDRFDELNIRINDMIRELFDTKEQFSQKCNLKYETVRKYIRVRSGKTLPKEMLAKFVIACGLSLEEADELFELRDHALQPEKILLDAVIVHCLQNHYDLDEFFDTCNQVNLDIEYKI